MYQIYGTMLCKDCVACLEAMDREKIDYSFLDITADLAHLKAFLAIRDGNALFDEVRRRESIGIPCVVEENGTVSLCWEDYVSQANA